MHLFELLSSLFPDFSCLDFGLELQPVDHEQKSNSRVLEGLKSLVDLPDDRQLELGLVIGRREVGLVQNAHRIDADPLAPKLVDFPASKRVPYIGIESFYSHVIQL